MSEMERIGWDGLFPSKGVREKAKRAIADKKSLHGFVREIMENWPDGDADGELQDLALKYGLLKFQDPPPNKPCCDECGCAFYYNSAAFADGLVRCPETTELLRGL